MQKAAEQ